MMLSLVERMSISLIIIISIDLRIMCIKYLVN